ncbi:MAG: glycosyltransferase family 1 protein [Candidatus Portnoybacteria bacterium]|jgi:glycosyltransferase involved in cell wall biosynthesis|nr:glycosyltransferase family 1 protein [Candidatus Portnoybacteria bacterium]
MTIGIDARFFGPRAKGLGRYTEKLIAELEKQDSVNDYVIFLRQPEFLRYQPANPRFKKVLADWRWYSLAEQIFMPLAIARQKVDLMHFPHFNVPIFWRGPFVVTVHDLILRHFSTRRASTLGPLSYWFKYQIYKIVIKSAVKRAAKIITISRFVKEDIMKSFNVPADRIAVIYEGAPAAESEKKIKNRPVGRYLLYVGNAYPHKNLENLLAAFEILRRDYQPDLRLVLVGEEDYFYRRLKARAPNGVVFAGFASDRELAEIYQRAGVYVFPSLCEGFGLPPLEAMACGVPVAAAKATCLPEVLGEAAVYFDPKDANDMASKIAGILKNNQLRQTLKEKGLAQIKKYSWEKMACQTMEIYAGVDFRTR